MNILFGGFARDAGDRHHEGENIGSPILGENVIVADGAKISGPVEIGDNTAVGAGAIITKDSPANLFFKKM